MTDPVTPKEALGVPARPVTEKGLEGLYALPLDVIDARTVAAREYLAFLEGPTDEDVEIAGAAYLNSWAIRQQTPVREHMRAALEAVAEARRQK